MWVTVKVKVSLPLSCLVYIIVDTLLKLHPGSSNIRYQPLSSNPFVLPATAHCRTLSYEAVADAVKPRTSEKLGEGGPFLHTGFIQTSVVKRFTKKTEKHNLQFLPRTTGQGPRTTVPEY